jgi:Domain of unknown function DUF83
MQELDDPIPLSALQHAVYCLRQAALIHIERQWEENRFTAEGRVLHDAAHDPADRKRGNIRRVMALPLPQSDWRRRSRRVPRRWGWRNGLSGGVQARQGQAAPRR